MNNIASDIDGETLLPPMFFFDLTRVCTSIFDSQKETRLPDGSIIMWRAYPSGRLAQTCRHPHIAKRSTITK